MPNKKKIINYQFNRFNPIGKKELNAANKVIRSGKLSGFLAGTGSEFQGGKYVKLFETKIKKFFYLSGFFIYCIFIKKSFSF